MQLTPDARYFGAFESNTLLDFWNVFHEWELKTVVEGLGRAGFLQSNAAQSTSLPSLSDAPPVLLYRAVCNLRVLQDEQIINMLQIHTPSGLVAGWPIDPPLAGILLLLLIENENVRRWAKAQVAECKVVPITKEHFTNAYVAVIQVVAHTISTDVAGFAEVLDELGATFLLRTQGHPGFPFAESSVDLWAGIYEFIRFIPPAQLLTDGRRRADLRRLVIGHLHDVGSRQ